MLKKTLIELLINVIKNYDFKDATIFTKENNSYNSVTREDIISKAFQLKNYFSEIGLKSKSKIAIISENRYEWIITDIACYISGNIDVPIYTSLSPESIKYILKDSNSVVCFVSNSLQLEKLVSVVSELPELKYIISFSELKNDYKRINIRSLESIFKNTIIKTQNEAIGILENLNKKISENDVLTIIYTSGTTGIPKGVMLSHKNIYTNIKSYFKILKVDNKDVFLSYLPYSHIFERSAGYYFPFFAASKIYYAQSIDTIGLQMYEVSPTIIITVPRLLDKMYNKLLKSYEEMPEGFQKKLFKTAMDLAKERKVKKYSIKWKLANRFVYKKIREKTGGKIKYFVSGGGALDKNVGEFFDYLGIETIEGYGMTETSPVISVNRPGKNKYGTVGPPVEGVKVKLAEDGEILVKGDIVMKGYYKEPDMTKEVLTPDGWFKTGDLGTFDQNNNLFIKGRLKNMIVGASGENIYPEEIESIINNFRFVLTIIYIRFSKQLSKINYFCVILWCDNKSSTNYDITVFLFFCF